VRPAHAIPTYNRQKKKKSSSSTQGHHREEEIAKPPETPIPPEHGVPAPEHGVPNKSFPRRVTFLGLKFPPLD
jgi:hypothetical protein